jgi:cbb3-type cytochrome oxidase maturation protein
MSISWLLIPLALVLLAFAVWAFFWAVDSGQFEDLEDAGRAVLDDDTSTGRQKGEQD